LRKNHNHHVFARSEGVDGTADLQKFDSGRQVTCLKLLACIGHALEKAVGRLHPCRSASRANIISFVILKANIVFIKKKRGGHNLDI
jgi:hypothetical protein